MGTRSAEIVLVGTCHIAEKSSRDVTEAAKRLRPSCLVLELCKQRLLPSLLCPGPHRAAWLGAHHELSYPTHADRELLEEKDWRLLWKDFSQDQSWAWVTRDSVEMVDALDASLASHGSDSGFLLVLGDITQSLREEDDEQRDVLIARSCAAALLLGHDRVMAVVGADHLDSVEAELRKLTELDLEALGLRVPVPIDDEDDVGGAPGSAGGVFISIGGITELDLQSSCQTQSEWRHSAGDRGYTIIATTI